MFLVDDASAVGIALELFEHRNMVARLHRRLWNLFKARSLTNCPNRPWWDWQKHSWHTTIWAGP